MKKINTNYEEITEDALPKRLRWDVPRQNQGQIVEVAYADEYPYADGADIGSLYSRVHDRGDNSVSYWRRVGPMWNE